MTTIILKEPHVCTIEWCGYTCHIEDGVAVREVSVSYGDAGVIDGERLCDCEDHE
jgi:hypothetical protein